MFSFKIVGYGFVLILVLFFSFNGQSQQSGFITRPAISTAGKKVLDPNGDGYTSKTTAGFGSNDVANSEIAYKAIPAFRIEPFGDTRRGSSHAFSDFVPGADSTAYYTFYDVTNLLFRLRLGSVISGSSGYSILIDTDGKFGATGTNADPNYQAATTGTNGNPGFEIEVVLETNSRIGIYNVDGTSTPTLVKAYNNWQEMSQVSIAASTDNANPDFFIDFFIPFADLAAAPFNVTTSTPIRMVSTTVMASKPAIGGPKSDIYGLDDALITSTNDQYQTYIEQQPPFTINDIGANGQGLRNICTAPPTVNEPIGTGTVNIIGTWTKSSTAGTANTATITVYKNGTAIGSPITNITSGSTWSLNGISLVNGDVITAKAQSTGESMCLLSNSVAAQACNATNTPSTSGLTFTCATQKGMAGTMPAGNQVRLYRIDPTSLNPILVAGPAGGSNVSVDNFGYSSSATWFYNSTQAQGADPCTGGSNDITQSTYYITTNLPGSSCESPPVFICVGNLTTTTAPTITQANIYNTTTQISGTAPTNARVELWINNRLQSTTATGGNYSFTGLFLTVGDSIKVLAVSTGSCASAPVTRAVLCFTDPPLINVDNNSQITAGSPISGTSSDPSGTTIRVFTSTGTLVATTTVQANGTWSTGTFNAIAGTTYYATAQNGTCGESDHSGNALAQVATSNSRCGAITGPVPANATSVSGTLTGSFTSTTVNLYLDGTKIGSISTNTAAWGPIPVNTTIDNTLYANGILTIGVQESGKQEVLCTSSATAITCSPSPTAPAVTPTNATILRGQNVTYTVSNAVSGSFYGISDAGTGQSLASGVWATANGPLPITTNVFNAPGTYNVAIKATSINATTVCTSSPAVATLTVQDVVVPVTFLSVKAKETSNGVEVTWGVSNEQDVARYVVERSTNCAHFEAIGSVAFMAGASDPKQYQFIDSNAVNGTACYRINQVDFDGTTHYSSVVSVNVNKAVSMRVAPNPATERTTLYIVSSVNGQATISVMDAKGQILLQQKRQLHSGSNSVPLEGLSHFSRGSYFIRVTSPDGVFNQKLLLE